MMRLLWIVCWGLLYSAGAQGGVSTERGGLNSSGFEGDGAVDIHRLKGDAGFVVFESTSSNLVPGDSNGVSDVFLWERATGVTTRLSVDGAGNEGNGSSHNPALSEDGRFVVFDSLATNLVPNDLNGERDVFVRDLQTNQLTLVSVNNSGMQGSGANGFGRSGWPSISGDGRFVVFNSPASNLVSGDTNNTWDIFLHDRDTATTSRLSVDSNGNESNDRSFIPVISQNARYVGYYSLASNLVSNDNNGTWDVFVFDRDTNTTRQVSVDSTGIGGNDSSFLIFFSGDGRYAGFESDSSNLVANDTNGERDAFVHNLETGVTEIVSLGQSGDQGDGASRQPNMSMDGRYVAFLSQATNLVSGDFNDLTDIFVRDRQTGKTELISRSSLGVQGDGDSFVPTISSNGRYVGSTSFATNLVPDDTNGDFDFFLHDRWAHEELVLSDASLGDRAGSAVAIFGDTAVVGARLDDHSGFANNGSAAVFDRDASTGGWSEVKSLRGVADLSSDQDKFGHSVAISGDLIAVGAENDDDAGFRAGKVYLYERDLGGTNNWGLLKELTGQDTEARDFFGRAVALDSDRLIVGAHVEDENGSSAGAAYVFERNAGGVDNWGQTQKLLASDGLAGDRFGAAVDIAGDNLIVGAFRHSTSAGSVAGQAYIFRNTAGTWNEVRKLTPAGAVANDQFGYSVAISGLRAAVGSRFSDGLAGNQTGSVHLFERDVGGTNNWGELQKIEASDQTAGDRFGSSVDIAGDRIVVGSPLVDDNGDKSGKVYVYKYDGNAFTENDQLINENVSLRDEFGVAVAIDEASCVVGSWLDNRPVNNTGGAYTFEVL